MSYILDKGNTYIKMIFQRSPESVIKHKYDDFYDLNPAE